MIVFNAETIWSVFENWQVDNDESYRLLCKCEVNSE